MASVMIVDDTAVDRRLAGGLLEGSPDIDVVVYAENGRDALEKIDEDVPDIIVTDLQMPEMDGLELVNQINEKFPGLPVVVMTAHGSESIAAQALANGAMSFVPKTELAANLAQTVQGIITMTQTEGSYQKLVQCTTKSHFEFTLDNDPEMIDPLTDMMQQMTLNQGVMTNQHRIQVGVAFENALTNAMFRGNLELDHDTHPVISGDAIEERLEDPKYLERRVFVSVLITAELVEFTIRDEGPGFDTSTLPVVSDPESYRDGVGRGLVLIQAFMDEVKFNDKGNEIHAVKHASE